jgi:four helix bundle protein
MKKESVLREKSFEFSLQIVELCRLLKEANIDHSIYRQLLRSGTAVGALVREAEYAQSKADFINKLSIALKEANETEYWFDLLCQSKSLNYNSYDSLSQLLTEIIKMLVSSIKTAKANKL